MKGKIIVAGANQCALAFAKFACEVGFDVELYEKKAQDEVAYDWTDNMVPATFKQVGLEMPPKSIWSLKSCWAFIPPDKQTSLYVDLPDEKKDIAIERRALTAWTQSLAVAAGAKVHYSNAVVGLLYDKLSVVGVKLADGSEVKCDFVVDCCGGNSPLRENLPKEFKIPSKLLPNEAFYAYRAYFDRPEGTPNPKYDTKVYLKHMGELGIAWTILEPQGKQADVLVGRLGELTEKNLASAMKDLRDENTFIGTKVLRGGETCCIPVRRAASRMVANGYALMGDSAFMTIPMMGSGIASGFVAARILADTINNVEKPFSIQNLYRYQRRFMLEVGGKNAGVDIMKNWMLETKPEDISFLLNRRIIGEDELKAGGSGETIKLGIGAILKKAVKGISRLPLLLGLSGMLKKMEKQVEIALSMPAEYDEEAFTRWQADYSKVYGVEI